jgi:hypothetical protein
MKGNVSNLTALKKSRSAEGTTLSIIDNIACTIDFCDASEDLMLVSDPDELISRVKTLTHAYDEDMKRMEKQHLLI